jgi:hypothetical protein
VSAQASERTSLHPGFVPESSIGLIQIGGECYRVLELNHLVRDECYTSETITAPEPCACDGNSMPAGHQVYRDQKGYAISAEHCLVLGHGADLDYEVGTTYEVVGYGSLTTHASDRLTVLDLLWYPDWRGTTVRVRWDDGSVHEHATPRDPRRMREVIEEASRIDVLWPTATVWSAENAIVGVWRAENGELVDEMQGGSLPGTETLAYEALAKYEADAADQAAEVEFGQELGGEPTAEFRRRLGWVAFGAALVAAAGAGSSPMPWRGLGWLVAAGFGAACLVLRPWRIAAAMVRSS